MESEKELLFPIDTYCKSGDFYFLQHFHCQQPMYFASFLNLGLMHADDIQVKWQFFSNYDNYDIKIREKYEKYVKEVLSKLEPENNFHVNLSQQILDAISDTYFFPFGTTGHRDQFDFVINQFCNNFEIKPEPLITYDDYATFYMENNKKNPYEKLYKIKSTFLVLMTNCINESTEQRKIIYEELKKIKKDGAEELKRMDTINISNYIINKLNSLKISCIINNEKNIEEEINNMICYERETDIALAAAFYLPKNSNIDLYSTDDEVLCIPFKYIYKFFCGKDLNILTDDETVPKAKKINVEGSTQFFTQEENSISGDTFEKISNPNKQEPELIKMDDISIDETVPKKINVEGSTQFFTQEENSISGDTSKKISNPNEQEPKLIKMDDISIDETVPKAKKINVEGSTQFFTQEEDSISDDTFKKISNSNEQEPKLIETDDISILKSSTSNNIQNSLKHRIFAGIFTIIGTVLFSIGVAAQLLSFGLPNPVSILFIVSGFMATCIAGTIFYYKDRQINKGNISSKSNEIPTFSGIQKGETYVKDSPVPHLSNEQNSNFLY